MYFRLLKIIRYFLCIAVPVVLANIAINFTNETPNYMVIPSDLNSDLILTQMILHLLTLVALMVYFPKGVINVRNTVMELLMSSVSAIDFTVMVSGLPSNYTDEELKRYMEHLSRDRETPVAAIVSTYDLKDLFEINKRIQELHKKLFAINGKFEVQKKCCRKTKFLDPEMYNQEIQRWEEIQAQIKDRFDENNRGRVAFVSYKSLTDAKEILEDVELSIYERCWKWLQFKKNKISEYNFNGRFLKFSRPPHPSDLNWDNLSIKSKTKIKSRLLTYTSSILILGIGGFLLYALRRYQHSEESSTLTLLPSALILCTNLFLEIFMTYITGYELHSSYTNYKISLARKLIVLMFMNTAVIPTLVNSYIVNEKDEWFEPGGLCSDVYTIIIINTIGPPLFYFYIFNPLYLLFLARLHFFKRKVQKGVRVTQEQANEYFTPIELDLAERYAQAIKTVYVGLFFSPLVPLSIAFSIVAVLIEFVVTKYMLNKHPIPRVHNETLALEMFEWLRYAICVYAVGVAFFYFEIDGNTTDEYTWDSVVYTALVIVILGFTYFLIPVNHLLNKKLYKNLKENIVKQFMRKKKRNDYASYRLRLDTDFERANPAFTDQAMMKFDQDMADVRDNREHVNENYSEWRASISDLLTNISNYNSLRYFGPVLRQMNQNCGDQTFIENKV